jgi:DNA-binding FadR family transcriptional regulator
MEFDVVQPAATHVAVADAIRRWIALGMFEPGDRLPTERELAARLAVGRMTVRHAVRLLAGEGLVGTQRGRSGGTYILDDADRPLRSGEVTAQFLADVRDNFDFRLGVEPMAARLAAERAEDMERWAIRGIAEGNPASYRAFRMLDSRFHLAIARSSHNRLLLDAVSRSRAEFFRWADAAWERVDWATLPLEERDFSRSHRPVAQAIEQSEPAEAEQRMREHLIAGKSQFLAAVEEAKKAQDRATEPPTGERAQH